MNIDELKQKEKEIQEQIRTWEDFKTTKRKYFAIPYPHLLEYSVYYETKVNEDNINQCKEKLNYFKIVSEYYENNDYIIDIECFIDGGLTTDYLEMIQITPEARAKLHKIVENLEKDIKEVEKAINR